MKKTTAKRTRAAVVSVAVMAAMAFNVVAPSVAFAESAVKTGGGLQTGGNYISDYSTREEVLSAGKETNKQLAAEGFVLLKNENAALPLATTAETKTKVTVLGTRADELFTGGGGSGAQSRPSLGLDSATLDSLGIQRSSYGLLDSLKAANYDVNPTVEATYRTVNSAEGFSAGMGGSTTIEGGHYMQLVAKDGDTTGATQFAGNYYKPLAQDDATLTVKDADIANGYNGTAVVVIGRTGSEGADNPSHNVAGHTDTTDHYMMLDDREKELFAFAKAKFDKVVVIINSPSVIELGDLENDNDIDSILWVGQPGWNGMEALGEILNGTINPSGHTVDFWMSNLKKDPSWWNFGDYTQSLYGRIGAYNLDGVVGRMAQNSSTGEMEMQQGTAVMNFDTGASTRENFIDYAEGIYMGYRYYETVHADLNTAQAGLGDTWYDAATVYPFGHGMSYTTFTQEIKSVEGELTAANKDGTIKVTVTVKNTGSKAGKEVVQLYSTPPYTAGGIDKAAVNFVGFAKTGMLEPEASQDVEITIKVKDLASFDYNGANKGEHVGYELEAGDYVLSIRTDSHNLANADAAKTAKTLTAAAQIDWDEDNDANTPNNIFSQTTGGWKQYNTLAQTWVENGSDHYLHRGGLLTGTGENAKPADLSKLAWMFDDIVGAGEEDLASNEPVIFTEEALNLLNNRYAGASYQDWDNLMTEAVETDYTGNPWLKTEVPANWTQGTGVADEDTGLYDMTLADMKGVTDYNDARWDTLINQLTWAELQAAVTSGGYHTPAVPSIGKVQYQDADGPGQLSNGFSWVCEVVISSTYNVELAKQQGRVVGNESMWAANADGTNKANGWYGPAMNTHRSPLSGRNFEYYSQDGVQGGLIAAAVVAGAQEMGCHVYIKHSFLNDQETNRTGTASFATEQAIREIYAKDFELCIRNSKANGIMTSFNLIGVQSSASWAINQQLYTNEWGYDGFTVTDFYNAGSTGWSTWAMVRGLQQPLGNSSAPDGTWDATAREGKGMVMVNQYDREAAPVASPTQWYWVRETAKRMLYVSVNGNGLQNGYIPSAVYTEFPTELQTWTDGKAITDINAVDLTALTEQLGADGYEVTATGLPEGVTFNASTGVISGTPTKRGIYAATVAVTGKGEGKAWIGTSRTLNIQVGPLVDFENGSSALTLNAFARYNQQLTQYAVELVTTGENRNYFPGQAAGADTYANGNGIVGVSYAAEGLPEGLKINASTGVIGGAVREYDATTPANNEYDVTLTVTLQRVTYRAGWSGQPGTYSVSPVSYTSQFKMTVNPVDLSAPRDLIAAEIDEDGHLLFIYGNGDIDDLGLVVGAPGEKGETGDKGDKGDTGAPGTPGEKGDKGDKGDTGLKGDTGDKGDKGDTGAAGVAGKDGKDGGVGAGVAGAVMGGIGLAAGAAALVLMFLNKKKA